MIGVRAQTITPELGDGLGLRVQRRRGRSRTSDPAARPRPPACARETSSSALDGKPMENARQLDVNLYQRALGDTVTLEIVRNGVRRRFPVTVVERPRDPDRFASLVTPERNLVSRLGVLAVELDADLVRAAGPLRGSEGVLIAARSGGRPGTEDDLRPGDVVYAINGISVRGLAELRSAVRQPASGESLVFHVERSGHLLYVVVELE